MHMGAFPWLLRDEGPAHCSQCHPWAGLDPVSKVAEGPLISHLPCLLLQAPLLAGWWTATCKPTPTWAAFGDGSCHSDRKQTIAWPFPALFYLLVTLFETLRNFCSEEHILGDTNLGFAPSLLWTLICFQGRDIIINAISWVFWCSHLSLYMMSMCWRQRMGLLSWLIFLAVLESICVLSCINAID